MPQPWYTPLEPLERRHDSHTVYRDFACLATCALSGGQREERYLETARRYTSDELHHFARALGTLTEAMECEPYTDLLGDRFLELEGRHSKQARGEFYTPQHICDLMAEMTLLPSLEEGQVLTVNDPACGSGGMVLGVARALEKRGISPLCIQATVQDLSRTAVDLAFINLTLWSIPTRAIVLGRTAPRGTLLAKSFWCVCSMRFPCNAGQAAPDPDRIVSSGCSQRGGVVLRLNRPRSAESQRKQRILNSPTVSVRCCESRPRQDGKSQDNAWGGVALGATFQRQ